MSDYKKRLQDLEIEVQARTSSLTLQDGRVVSIPPLGWLTVADYAIEESAARYEGTEPPEPTPEQARLKALFAQARFDPTWCEAECKVWQWAKGEVNL
jgi:hypothetical protein